MTIKIQQLIQKNILLAFLCTGVFTQAQIEIAYSQNNTYVENQVLFASNTQNIEENTIASNLPVTTIQRHVVPGTNSTDSKKPLYCKEVELAISFDEYPEDISWVILDSSNNLVAKANRYNSFSRQKVMAMKQCLAPGTYTFIIKDNNEDGLCCQQSRGFYHLYVTNGTSLASGASFGSRETTIFTIHNPEDSENEVSIDRVQTTEQIKYSLFPNPVTSGSLLEIDAPRTFADYTIYNSLGKIAQHGKLHQNAINIDALESGRYMIEINADSRPIVLDFVKK